MNILTLKFRCVDCNGLPQARVCLDGKLVHDHEFTTLEQSLDIELHGTGDRVLTVERYNKQRRNMVLHNERIVLDQILEIADILVDGVSIPDLLLQEHCEFSWDNNTHRGSRYFGPNGTWTYCFSTPIITHLLDLKIAHESKYSQDYEFPWSNRLGPNSVQEIISTIAEVEKKVHEVL